LFSSPQFALYVVWPLVTAILIARSWRGHSAGLALTYSFQLWLFYWLGAFVHALPWAELPDTDVVNLGFEQATYGLAAFVGGCLAVLPIVGARLSGRARVTYAPDPKLSQAYVVAGLIGYLLMPVLNRLPSMNAVSAVATQLIVVGISLGCWKAWLDRSRARLIFCMLACLAIPAVTLGNNGFLSYGALAVAAIYIFVGQFFRPRWVLIVAAPLIAYAGLSFFTEYMRHRFDLRLAVWGGETYSTRTGAICGVICQVRPFSIFDQEALDAIDTRLDQSTLAGHTVVNLHNTGAFVHGETLWAAVLGVIPRLVWPSKPMTGGSGDLATRFTGLTFGEGTSVGVGPVMEFYANFGTAGIVVGFFFLGALIGAMDLIAAAHLANGNWHGFARSFLIGVMLLNVSGSLVEVSSSGVTAVLVGMLINRILKGYQHVRETSHRDFPQSSAAAAV
jgi:hypothetical protein